MGGGDSHWPELTGPLRQILEGTAAGVGVLDTELRYRYVNPALARMNGVPAAEHLGRTIAEVVPGIDAREDVLRAVLADGEPRETTSSGHTRALSTLRRRYWHGAYHRLTEGGRTTGLVGIVLEVTASREQQHELEQARNRLTLLDAAATRIGTTLHMDTTCGELADYLVPTLAEIATVEVLPFQDAPEARPATKGHLRLRRAAMAALAELREEVGAFGTPGEYVDYQPGSAVPRCLATGRPVISNVPDDETLRRAAPNAGRVPGYRALGIHSALVVPLAARGHQIGTVTLTRVAGSPAFTGDDATAAQDLVRRAAISLDNARRYTREHSIALDLQRALLADPGEPHPDLDVAFRYRPAGTSALVGGDWYETAALPDGRTLLAIGDVMGHSLEAAVEMSHYQAMLRVLAGMQLPPEQILEQMDTLLGRAKAARPATCLVVTADPAGGSCRYASAGHLPPAVVHPDGRTALLPVNPGPPLGTGLGGYRSATAELPAHHTLLLYTDGLVERRGEDIDDSLRRLTRLRLPPHAPADQLLDAVLALAPAPAEDDIALLAATALPYGSTV
ncbi:diguanylate cyclase [Kitasatospora sp. MMS16-BH015]|uniref:SpoIIE family protein phosphatase n=1 Tax=Kitasatospora sp. MMS16-BH015 TaxID=2018025 RepID=UPI000CA0D56B|nr:SpoIIE family protein phosphatase [Kitasatospora sp. MMS16-BH015]AUG81173.1 diguanylate cyclase [Kitasatospora sp. MMS16-BH015]